MKHNVELYHDFNKLYDNDIEGYVTAPLICHGTIKQMKSENITLTEGQVITLFDPDDVDTDGNPDRLEVDAKVSFDQKNGYWIGEFSYVKLKYRSEK